MQENIKKIKNRDLSLDAIAGFFIILMMFQHFNINTRAPYTIGHIFMFNTSWFFFKSGMFHKPTVLSKSLIHKWAYRFLIPFVIFSLLGLFMEVIISWTLDRPLLGTIYGFATQIYHLGAPWWNIPVWFLLTMLFVKVMTVDYKGGLYSSIFWIGCSLIIIILHNRYIHDFNYIGNSAMAVLFYVMGYLSSRVKFKTIAYVSLIVISIASIFIYPSAIDIWSNRSLYGSFGLSIVAALAGMILINKIFEICSFLKIKPFIFFGQNAMIFLVFHVPIALAVRELLRYNSNLGYTSIHWIEALVTIPICILFCFYFDKNPKLRWIIGG